MRVLWIVFVVLIVSTASPADQKATIKKVKMEFNTYMFSDPDPVPRPGRIYPYFRFDGYTARGEMKEWDMVVMENQYIRVYVCPDIGGKVWGAVEKSTGLEFLYFNHAVKFRDIAMRGPWTSGGLEFNFGDIGHIPTCATPVDYKIREHADGSVSCVVGAMDLPSRTRWNVNILLGSDTPYFETRTSWFNNTPLPVTYYHWMNAAAKADGNLEFLYPGNRRIGHGGEVGDWPIDKGRKISMYNNNNFGSYKSYHVINSYSNYFGGYWHEDNFGFGHLSEFDEKPGRKIWIWGLSDQGMIWEDLLTDSDGQYIEYQAGKLFNQAVDQSTYSPFKHREFSAHDSDIMRETWFPILGTKGMAAASRHAVLNVIREGNRVELLLSALQKIDADLVITIDNKQIGMEKIKLNPLGLYQKTFHCEGNRDFDIELGGELLRYSSRKNDLIVNRPVTSVDPFDWDSAYGLYIKGLEHEKQRRYAEAMRCYKKSIEMEPTFLPALSRISLGRYRRMDYRGALKFAQRALSLDTYDPLANYMYGLAGMELKQITRAKNGFSIASHSVEFRSAAFTQLAEIFLKEDNFQTAETYARKALAFNRYNVAGLEVLAVIYRKTNQKAKASKILHGLDNIDPLNHFINFEKFKLKTGTADQFKKLIANELPHESYLDLAIRYYALGCEDEAVEVLEASPEHPVVFLWMAYLNQRKREILVKRALDLSAQMVFPHRAQTARILETFRQSNPHWKLKYYSGLIYWNRGLEEKAREMFLSCGAKPDIFPFYLAKARLFGNPKLKLKALKKAGKLNPGNWRISLAWIRHDLETGDFDDGIRRSRLMIKKHPEISVFALLYAKLLLKSGAYTQGVDFLETCSILPFEGATRARDLYHTLCIRSAYKYLNQKEYASVIDYAGRAKLWPKNLGVGKPYDVDERLDDFIIAHGYERLDDFKKARQYYSKIAAYSKPSAGKVISGILLQVIALKRLGRLDEAEAMVDSALKNDPRNEYLKWFKTTLNNPDDNKDPTFGLNQKKFDNDHDFQLVVDLLGMMKEEK